MRRMCKSIAVVLIIISMFTMVLPISAAPVTMNELISLNGDGGGDGPKNVKAVGDLGVRFTVPANYKLKAFGFKDCPTWTKKDSSVDVVLYKWKTDYDTTIAGTEVARFTKENHADNTDLIFDVGDKAAGEYLVVMEASSATNDIGSWTNTKKDGSELYVNGDLVDYQVRSYIKIYKTVDSSEFPVISENALVFSNSEAMSAVSNNAAVVLTNENGLLKITHQESGDPGFHIRLSQNVNTSLYKYMGIKLKKGATEKQQFQVFYDIRTGGASGDRVISGTYQDTNDWQLVLLDIGATNFADMGYFRYDSLVSSKEGETIEVEWIKFFQTEAAAQAEFSGNPQTYDTSTLFIMTFFVSMIAVIVLKKRKVNI